MTQALHKYYLGKQEPNKGCLLALRDTILSYDAGITETQKYGMPCFCYRKTPFCYLWTDKQTDKPYILMVEGRHLTHPKLEQGNRSRMKILRIDPDKNLPVKTIGHIVKKALSLYTTGVIKCKQ